MQPTENVSEGAAELAAAAPPQAAEPRSRRFGRGGTRRSRRWLRLAIVGLIASFIPALVGAGAAQAATGGGVAGKASRPAFQLPFACGTQVRLESFGHAPAVDIFRVPTKATENTVVVAPAAGTVTQSYSNPRGAGNIIQINHGGRWFTTYIHLRSRAVRVGQHVAAGTVIGRVGHTGVTSNGVSHLHFEMAIDRNGDGRADWGVPNKERVTPVFNGVTYATRNSQTARAVSHNCPRR
ncbi:Peptidase family M23 (modular protein) [Frankia canadensis]|uniref:Peptidase family M23 (Modular protein) n=1 Tax=Frankia canadensis TaxID=1836972 RepID=A0A2I2KYD3_9ACTN|nr:M23 family metallopeptidase [Frankia canadensis]SNQ50682.1 Peptidase family M23 (modular protein) [Frankia canadensis]SOU57972.1 Peptidase family M23 (modular protein) [Frankia canadensis]